MLSADVNGNAVITQLMENRNKRVERGKGRGRTVPSADEVDV